MSIRTAICGGDDLRRAAADLGLAVTTEQPEIALIDLRHSAGLAVAATLPPALARVVIADTAGRSLARALGWAEAAIVDACDPALLGPALRALVPPVSRKVTRVVLLTSARGGVGRTLLAVNLALRLARERSVLLVDATGSGSASWWLRADARPWTELEGLTAELSEDHLAVVASGGRGAPRVLGGAPRMPSLTLLLAAARAATALASLVVIDAPTLADERTRALQELADRVLVVSYDDPLARALLDAAEVPAAAWLVASQSRAVVIGDREVFCAIPRDENAVASAAQRRSPVGGPSGRAYDRLATILAEDSGR